MDDITSRTGSSTMGEVQDAGAEPRQRVALQRRADRVSVMAGTRPDYCRLVARVTSGDRDAWNDLIEALKRVAWRAIVSVGLPEHDGKDAFAATFFRLFEHLEDVREPEKLPGWVATTARREAYAVIRARGRTTPVEDLGSDRPATTARPPDERLLDAELLRAVAAAVQRLSPRDRQLLVLLTTEPPLSYDEISEQLDMKRGSIGPTRQRIIAKLRRAPEITPFLEGEDDHA